MAGPASMVAAARADLGMSGRPNRITRAYASRNGAEFLRASWCDMGVTDWARTSGNTAAVLPRGDRAYTPWHAGDFAAAGRWFAGTTANVDRARPGDVVFFDWSGSNDRDAIDHVGIVEKPLGGGRVQTIEANTGDAVRRRVRAAPVIAGYGRPAYGDAGAAVAARLPLLRRGATGEHVETLRGLLLARSHPEVRQTAGVFDATVERAVRAVQEWGRVDVDGEVGPQTWPVLLRLVGSTTDLPLLRRGATGEHVETLRGLLLARSHPEVRGVDGPFDATVERAVQAVQEWGRVDVDGEVGPQTWPVLLRVHQ